MKLTSNQKAVLQHVDRAGGAVPYEDKVEGGTYSALLKRNLLCVKDNQYVLTEQGKWAAMVKSLYDMSLEELQERAYQCDALEAAMEDDAMPKDATEGERKAAYIRIIQAE